MHRVDYDRLSSNYNQRYQAYSLHEIGEALARIVRGRVLEIGCGTGRWLSELAPAVDVMVGADSSFGMLKQHSGGAPLVNADANTLPFRCASFDCIFCVNALHHFGDKPRFIRDAAVCLKLGGTLAIVGIDPRTVRSRYMYEYFDTTLATDLERYPSFGQIVDAMCEAGLEDVEHRIVYTWTQQLYGGEVLDDPFLGHDSNSALALLTAEEYRAGLARIREAARASKSFTTILPFGMTTGRRT